MPRSVSLRAIIAIASFVFVAIAGAQAWATASVESYACDGTLSLARPEATSSSDSPADTGLPRIGEHIDASRHSYHYGLGLARAAARLGGYGSAPSPTAGSTRNVNPLGGTQNCVNCVVATDARLAGRPASALNSAGPQPISILGTHFDGTFKPVAGRAEIERILSSSGHGSRGIVFGRRGADPGHVFNAVNQNGVIRFLDGKTGRTASFNGFSEFFFLPTS